MNRYIDAKEFKQALAAAEAELGSAPLANYKNQLIAHLIAYTAVLADRVGRTSVIIDRDLDTSVPKAWRQAGLRIAVQLGWITPTQYRGKPAWRRSVQTPEAQ